MIGMNRYWFAAVPTKLLNVEMRPQRTTKTWKILNLAILFLFFCAWHARGDELEQNFAKPPANARAWVYWYFMDGMMTREGMTADLEAMRRAGIGGAIFLEVNIGLPRGPVEFMSPQWQELFKHAVKEANRTGIEIALGT